MDNNEYVARTICEQLNSASPLVLASIVSLQGSSPRHSGTKMVVRGDGKSYGTIGGSLLEAMAVNGSRAVLHQQCSRFMYFDLAGDNAHSQDMICGGKVALLLDFVPATKENIEFFRYWYDAIFKGDDFYFLTLFQDNDSIVNVICHSLFYPGGKVISNYSWSEQDIEKPKSELHNVSSTALLPLSDKKVIIDPIRRTKTLYCFGAGHVAVPTTHIAALEVSTLWWSMTAPNLPMSNAFRKLAALSLRISIVPWTD